MALADGLLQRNVHSVRPGYYQTLFTPHLRLLARLGTDRVGFWRNGCCPSCAPRCVRPGLSYMQRHSVAMNRTCNMLGRASRPPKRHSYARDTRDLDSLATPSVVRAHNKNCALPLGLHLPSLAYHQEPGCPPPRWHPRQALSRCSSSAPVPLLSATPSPSTCSITVSLAQSGFCHTASANQQQSVS